MRPPGGSGDQGQQQGSDAWPSLQPGQAGSYVPPKSDSIALTNGSRSSSSNSLNRTNTPPNPSNTNSSCNKTVGNGRVRSASENTK